MNNIYKVFLTKYDGFIITLSKNGNIRCYEGKALCPKYLQKWLESNEPIILSAFHNEAISYGWIC